MLTLLSPIRLKTASPVLMGDFDLFSKRICGNYEIMCARFTPKELLLLFLSPFELPEGFGGTFILTSQNSAIDESKLTLEVVNQVVNRILLAENARFTYQDRVYITWVLEKLGITNTTEFLRQVRQTREENRSLRQLNALYESHLTLVQSLSEQALRQYPSASAEHKDAPERTPSRERLFLQNAIYRRLGTSRLYREVNLFQQDQNAAERRFQRAEFHTAEQLRLSALLRLSELKRHRTLSGSFALCNLVNRYERGGLLPPPKNEQQVFRQLAAAALLNTIRQSLTLQAFQLTRTQQSHFWLDLSAAVGESGGNTVARYEMWHRSPYAGARYHSAQNETQNNLYRTEYNLLTRLISKAKSTHFSPLSAAHFHSAHTALSHFSATGGEAELLLNEVEPLRRLAEVLRAERLPEAHVPRGAQAPPAVPGTSCPLQSVHSPEPVQPVVNRLLQRITGQEPPAPPAGTRELETLSEHNFTGKDHFETERLTERENSALLHERLDLIDSHNREMLRQVHESATERLYEPPSPRTADAKQVMTDALRALNSPERVLRDVLERPEEPPLSAPLPPQTTLLLAKADEPTRKILEAALRHGQAPAQTGETLLKTSTLASFYRETVLAEQNGPAPPMRHPAQEPPESEPPLLHKEKQALPLTMPHRPHHFRGVAGEPSGLSAPLCGAAVQKALFLKHKPAAAITKYFTHKMAANRRAFPHIAHRTQPLPTADAPVSGGEAHSEHFPLPFVYKQEQQFISEELLKKLAARCAVTEQTTQSQTIHRDDARVTELEQVNRQTVRQTTEDISELISQQLARQLGTLSEKVYSQIEKRLRMERARRGR